MGTGLAGVTIASPAVVVGDTTRADMAAEAVAVTAGAEEDVINTSGGSTGATKVTIYARVTVGAEIVGATTVNADPPPEVPNKGTGAVIHTGTAQAQQCPPWTQQVSKVLSLQERSVVSRSATSMWTASSTASIAIRRQTWPMSQNSRYRRSMPASARSYLMK